MSNLPIGVFDSGVGGLTVLRGLAEQFPGEKFLYLADTARLPYGTKSSETIEHYFVQNLKFLLREGVKAVVVACNSASSVLIRRRIPSPVPVLNVIGPGSRAACKASESGRIGVVGTRATVQSGAYVDMIKGIREDAVVHQQACPLLVNLVEENWIDDPLTNMIVYRYLRPLLREPIDALVLGCTHYPALRSSFAKVVGPGVALVDSIGELTRELAGSVKVADDSARGEIHIVATDLTPHLRSLMAAMLVPVSPKSVRLVDLR